MLILRIVEEAPQISTSSGECGFKFLRWNAFGLLRAAGRAVFGVGPGAEDNGEQRSRRESLDNLHDLPPKFSRRYRRERPSSYVTF
jgi:hypothetical protein